MTEVVTSRFPAGLSVFDCRANTASPPAASCRERSKRLVLIVFDAPAHKAKVIEIVEAYKAAFRPVQRVRVEQPVCAGLSRLLAMPSDNCSRPRKTG